VQLLLDLEPQTEKQQNIEHGMSNDEVFFPLDFCGSIFDI